MRQLDLFGSLFETPSPKNKPGENKEASNNDEIINAAEAAEPYSKNFLGSERPVSSDVAIAIESDKIETEVSQNSPAIATPSPLLLSLFDAPFSTKNPEPAKPEFEVIVPEPIPEIVAVETTGEEIIETNLAVPDLSNTIEISTAKNYVEIADEPAVSALVTEVKKAEKPKQKNQKLPELERNGSVIFDDGKISVKIKNKNPFPPPAVKEKKEKLKKIPQKRGRKSFKEIDAEVDLIEIPEDEVLFQKQYYGISEVAKWFRVNTSLLRFWENEFDVLKPRKNRKGDRLFRPEDVKNLQLIYQLLRQRKYTIEGAKEYIKTNRKKADIQLQLTNTLQKFKSFLLDMKANLQP